VWEGEGALNAAEEIKFKAKQSATKASNKLTTKNAMPTHTHKSKIKCRRERGPMCVRWRNGEVQQSGVGDSERKKERAAPKASERQRAAGAASERECEVQTQLPSLSADMHPSLSGLHAAGEWPKSSSITIGEARKRRRVHCHGNGKMREPENAQKAVVEKKGKIEERGKSNVVAATSAAK